MITPISNPRQKLDELANQFASWRRQRASRTEAIPDDLWKQAAALVPSLKKSVVAKRLGVECGKLSRKIHDGLPAQPTKGTVPTNVQLIKVAPLHIDTPFPSQPARPSIEISRADGALLRVVGVPSDAALATVVGLFVGGSR